MPEHLYDVAAARPDAKARPVCIAVVDDEQGVHQFLGRIFSSRSQAWIIESYLDGSKALDHLPRSKPDAVVMDLAMPGLGGLDCMKKLRVLLPELPVIVFSAHIDLEALMGSMMAGACGCLLKPAKAAEIILALEKILHGSLAFCPRAEQTLRECFNQLRTNYDYWELTGRERDVLDCFCRRKTDKEIASLLQISASTVHVHTASIFKKLDVHARAEAVRKITSIRRLS